MLSLAIVFSAAGCGVPKMPDSETDLEIFYWRAGWGIEYLNRIIEAFEEDYPEYNVMLDDSADLDYMARTIEHGADYNSIDLYITNSDPGFFSTLSRLTMCLI